MSILYFFKLFLKIDEKKFIYSLFYFIFKDYK